MAAHAPATTLELQALERRKMSRPLLSPGTSGTPHRSFPLHLIDQILNAWPPWCKRGKKFQLYGHEPAKVKRRREVGRQLAASATGREGVCRQKRRATSSNSLLPWGLIAAFKASLNKIWKANSLVIIKLRMLCTTTHWWLHFGSSSNSRHSSSSINRRVVIILVLLIFKIYSQKTL